MSHRAERVSATRVKPANDDGRAVHTTSDGLICVVTPVYNDAEYLAECIESVLSQTHANWVHVLADNASTDETPEIAESYSKRDSRIVHIRSDQFLPDVNDSINRALGLTDPASSWCKVVQADDWLYPECLAQMLAVGETQERIGVVSAYQRKGDRVHLTHFPYDQVVMDGRTVIARTLINEENVTGGPTAVMYRSEIVLGRNVFYDAPLQHADTDAAFRTLLDHDMGFVHQVLTYARRQGDRNLDRAEGMGTPFAEDLLFVLRYGPAVLEPAVCRATVRRYARKYAAYLAKQALRPSRQRNRGFVQYHLDALGWLEEVDDGSSEIAALVKLGPKLFPLRKRR